MGGDKTKGACESCGQFSPGTARITFEWPAQSNPTVVRLCRDCAPGELRRLAEMVELVAKEAPTCDPS